MTRLEYPMLGQLVHIFTDQANLHHRSTKHVFCKENDALGIAT